MLGMVLSARFPKDLKLKQKKKTKKVNAIGALVLGMVTSAKFPKDLVPVYVTGYPLNSSRIPESVPFHIK